jgi:hypothetical protein
MKALTLLFLATVALSMPTFAQSAASPVEGAIYFTNLESEYRKFSDIKPKFVNTSVQSVFLKWFYPNGAKLMRLSEETGKWEAGGTGIGCATGMSKPVEIKSGETIEITLDWEMSTDDFNNPKFFELADHKTHRPLSGRYKIFMPYTLEVWALGRNPKRIYTVESFEFSVLW